MNPIGLISPADAEAVHLERLMSDTIHYLAAIKVWAAITPPHVAPLSLGHLCVMHRRAKRLSHNQDASRAAVKELTKWVGDRGANSVVGNVNGALVILDDTLMPCGKA